MSVITEERDDDSPAHPGEHHGHGPSDGLYFRIFLILVSITALEVSTYFWASWFGYNSRYVAVPVLVIMMVVKFLLIASFFMHLRFDRRVLTRVFYSGLVLAVVVYMAALSTMNIWTANSTPWYNDPPPAAQRTTTSTTPGG